MRQTEPYGHTPELEIDWWTVAEIEGWGFFNGCEIQRLDSRNEFASDLHATMHVITRAVADPDSPHMEALRFWKETAEDEYIDTVCSIMSELPGFGYLGSLVGQREDEDVRWRLTEKGYKTLGGSRCDSTYLGVHCTKMHGHDGRHVGIERGGQERWYWLEHGDMQAEAL